MGQEALEAAIYKYRGIEVEQHDDDDGTLICACYGHLRASHSPRHYRKRFNHR